MNKKSKNFPITAPSIGKREIAFVLDAVRSGWVSSLGPYIKKFEEAFAKFIGVKYALTASSGTAALHLALLACGIQPGDEVIVPDLTFIATANAVQYAGAKPVFVDIDPETWCIAPELIRKAITAKTQAIIPVHLYGHPAEMDSIMRIAREHHLTVIEDAAEAHGAEYKDKKVGGIGKAGVFSFFGNKVITTGEGGMVTTNDKKIYERARSLRNQAMNPKRRYWHTEIGFNYRMTNMQAALGMAQLERTEEFLDKKRRIFGWYKKYLSNLLRFRKLMDTGFPSTKAYPFDIKTSGDEIMLNPEKSWAKNSFWMICLFLNGDFKLSRDQMITRLQKMGIDARPFLYPVSQMPMYQSCRRNPIAEYVASHGLNLPSSVNLKKGDVRWIVQNIKTCLGKK